METQNFPIGKSLSHEYTMYIERMMRKVGIVEKGE